VDNFRRELDPDGYAPATGRQGAAPDRRAAAMRRDVASAESSIRRVETELDDARRNLSEEREAEERCRRREILARQIEDDETARIAAEYAARHAERAAVLRQKIEALAAERDLLRRDLDVMRAALAELAPASVHTGAHLGHEAEPHDDAEFRRLEEEARERAAEARLEELKRKMR
jgi:hypothetical protein